MVVLAEPRDVVATEIRAQPRARIAGNRAELLMDARADFLATRRMSPVVRHEIAMSWRRSLLAGVSPTNVVPGRGDDVNFDCQLVRVARPVLEERELALARSGCALVLTDADARVLARWGEDPDLERELDAHDVLPGYCFAEWIVGTNSAALAIESGEPSEVHGSEHFAQEFAMFSSAGAPITHPVGRRMLGSLNVVCPAEDANPLLMPWLLEVVRDIERRLRAMGCVQEQLLLESYVAAKRDSRRPVVCLNDQTILTNSAAARLLGAVDKALLWEQASRAINERASGVATVSLSDGRRILAYCEPLYNGGAPFGAKIEIEFDQQDVPKSQKGRTSATPAEPLEGLAGHGVCWQRFCDEARAAAASSPLLLLGEPGTGKHAVAMALLAAHQVDVFDAGLHGIERTKWLRQLATRLDDSTGAVVVQHLEALDEQTARTVASLIAAARANGPRVVCTVRASDDVAWDAFDHVLFDHVLKVPPLRDRRDDMRDLVQALSARHAAEGATWQWMPDAIQTLSRLDWPANVRSLASVVKQVVAGRRGGYIDARGLPEAVRAAASRRPLSRLEQVEAVAITEALTHTQGNKLEAAQSLGIARSTLYRRMRALGIDLSEANY